MRAVVVHAHPLPTSLTRHFCDIARAGLKARGHRVDFVDLYQDGFDALLTPEEHKDRHTPKPAPSDVAPLIDQLAQAEIVVLVFPTWWFGLPAVLKGYIDRVFAPHVAFLPAENSGPIKSLLDGLRYAVAITTLGSPWWVDWLVLRRPVRRVLKTAVFGACAPQAKFAYLPFYASEIPTQARVDSFDDRIRQQVGGLS